MDLDSGFMRKLEKAEDEFDMIALCFDELISNMPCPHKAFVASYIDRMETVPDYSPFQCDLATLRQAINDAAMQIKTGIGPFKDAFTRLYQDFTDAPKGTSRVSWAIYMFYTICAIDGYLGRLDCELSYYGAPPPNSPRNHLYAEKYLVYPKKTRSFLQNAYRGSSGYRKPLRDLSCGDYFSAVQIVERNRLPEPRTIPKICRLPLPSQYEKQCRERKRLRIASIPFAGFPTFFFCNKGSKIPVTDLLHLEGEFYIRYDPDRERQNTHRATALLDAAIQDGANIVVFPEFIMSPGMLKAIAEHLHACNQRDKESSQLIFVIAGTTYQHSGDQYSNVMHIIKANGTILPQTYYKFNPFYTENEPPDREQEETASAPHFKNIEMLTSPGKECTLLDVEGLALILPAICRDAIDGNYSQLLANIFHPDICIVSAWSRSESTFHIQLEGIADTIHTTSLLCNCCDAIEKSGEAEIGLLVVPRKVGTAMRAKTLPFLRGKDCHARCRDGMGCVYRIDLNFSSTIQSISDRLCIHIPDGPSPS